MKQEFIEIANAYGWIEIESKNPYMRSFATEAQEQNYRMNVYNTGKIQVQPIGIKHAPGKIFSDVNSVEQFEDILIHFK